MRPNYDSIVHDRRNISSLVSCPEKNLHQTAKTHASGRILFLLGFLALRLFFQVPTIRLKEVCRGLQDEIGSKLLLPCSIIFLFQESIVIFHHQIELLFHVLPYQVEN